MKYLKILLLFIVFSISYSNNPKESLPIIVAGVPKEFPPQYSIDKNGKSVGFAIDLMNQLAKSIEINVRYRQYDSWAETFLALRKGEVDVIPNLGITPERVSDFIFTKPIETFEISIITRSSTNTFYSIEDLKGKVVGTVLDNAGGLVIKDRYDIKKESFADIHKALVSLLSGNIDALIYPKPVIKSITSKAGLENRIKISSNPLIEIKRAVALNNSNQKLRDKFNVAIDNLYKSESYWSIYNKWYGEHNSKWSLKQIVIFMSCISILIFLMLIFWRYKSVIHLNKKLTGALRVIKHTEDKLQDANDTLENKVKLRTQQLTDANHKLMEALEKVHDLRGLLPICSMCKRVKDDDGYWNQVESYIEGHSHAKFSHGFCPECAEAYKQKNGIK